MIRWLIMYLYRRAGGAYNRVVTFDDVFLFKRWYPFWPDEIARRGKVYFRPPWYRPFNVMLHCWRPQYDGGIPREGFHDHPRWTITVCLRGRVWEYTPWGKRLLKPGSIQFRTRKFIHAFEVPPEWRGRTWTLFIAGRRNHVQSTYIISPKG